MKGMVRSGWAVVLLVVMVAATGCVFTGVPVPAVEIDCEGLPNCSFEELRTVNGIVAPVDYNPAEDGGSSNALPLSDLFLVDSTVSRSGSHSVKLVGHASSRPALSHLVNVEGGKTYKFSVWFRSVDGIDWDSAGPEHEEPVYLTVRLQVRNEQGQTIDWTPDWVIAGDQTVARKRSSGSKDIHLYTTRRGEQDGGWYPLEVTLAVPEEAASIRISLMNWYGRSDRYNKEADVWYDDISLKLVE